MVEPLCSSFRVITAIFLVSKFLWYYIYIYCESLINCNITFQANQEKLKPDDIMESTTDAADWKMEVERVLPQLKVTIRTDNKVGLKLICSECFH